MKQSAIQSRREQVSRHLAKGASEERIAELLGVGRATVARDVAHVRKDATVWLDELAKDGFIYEYRMTLEKIRDHGFELQRLLEKATVAQEIQIYRALDENARLYLELLGETPTVHAYRRALRRLEESRRKLGVQ